MSSGYYIMVDGEPQQTDDAAAWAKWYEDHREERIVARTSVAPGLLISTVFLGLDHAFGGGEPVLFETMVFGGDWAEQEQERYSTIDEARRGHARMVTKVIDTITLKGDD